MPGLYRRCRASVPSGALRPGATRKHRAQIVRIEKSALATIARDPDLSVEARAEAIWLIGVRISEVNLRTGQRSGRTGVPKFVCTSAP